MRTKLELSTKCLIYQKLKIELNPRIISRTHLQQYISSNVLYLVVDKIDPTENLDFDLHFLDRLKVVKYYNTFLDKVLAVSKRKPKW